MILDLGQEKNSTSIRLMRKTYRRRRHKKKRCPPGVQKEKSPQRGFGGDDSGFHCLCFYFCCFRSVMNKLFCFLGKLNV